MQPSIGQTIRFAAAVCVVAAIAVSSAAVGLKERQEANKLLDRQSKVLGVAGLIEPGEKLTAERAQEMFDEYIVTIPVELETGEIAEEIDPVTYDQRSAAQDPATSQVAPPNPAKVSRLPDVGLVYQVMRDGIVDKVILPVEGMGLWSTLYGYIALEADLERVAGITFYEHGETAGLGGEVDNPRWQALWPGRRVFDEDGDPAIEVIKGAAGPPEEDPYEVDGLAGATLTSRGVTNLLHLWLGPDGFGPYLDKYRRGVFAS
jgi:Na+-transporting NADH:ubiquinone oxidoreductase subunit C